MARIPFVFFSASVAAGDALSLGQCPSAVAAIPRAPPARGPMPRREMLYPARNYTASCYNVKCYNVIIL